MKKVSETERLAYRTAARIWLDLSDTATKGLPVACSFIGAYCYAAGVPVTVYSISKLFVCNSYRQAKRWVDQMVDAGALGYTENGMVMVTEQGNQTSDWYFQRIFEMCENVSQAEPKVSAKIIHLDK